MTVTKSIPLACSPWTAWKLLADGVQWPRWAIRKVLASEPLDENRWEIQTPRGPGVLHIRGLEDFGILDHGVRPDHSHFNRIAVPHNS